MGSGGRVALITGASRGIGLAVARRLVTDGWRVCITARNAEPLAVAAEELGGAEHAIAVAGKADDEAHQEDAVARTVGAFGRLDLLVNNTGINPVFGPMLDIELGALRKLFDVNVFAVLGWLRLARDAGLGKDGGAVVNVASLAGIAASPGIGAYGVSKAALIHLTRQLAAELAPEIRVNAVAPAVVRTQFARLLYEGQEEAVSRKYPLGRFGVPEDVASAVVYLGSPEAAWVTGQTLILDGGISLTSEL